MVWGGETTRAHAYWYDRTQGATPLSGAALHAIDALNVTLGQFGHLSADLVLGRTQVTVTDDGNTVVPVTAPDQVSSSAPSTAVPRRPSSTAAAPPAATTSAGRSTAPTGTWF